MNHDARCCKMSKMTEGGSVMESGNQLQNPSRHSETSLPNAVRGELRKCEMARGGAAMSRWQWHSVMNRYDVFLRPAVAGEDIFRSTSGEVEMIARKSRGSKKASSRCQNARMLSTKTESR